MRATVGEKDDMIEVGGRSWWGEGGSLDVGDRGDVVVS